MNIGDIAQLKIAATLIQEGYTVSVPIGQSRYDLIIERDAVFKRVQCKAGRVRNGVIVFNLYSIGNNRRVRYYDSSQIDLYGVYCLENDQVYLVPQDAVGSGKGYLRLNDTKSGQRQGIRWARDFEIAVKAHLVEHPLGKREVDGFEPH